MGCFKLDMDTLTKGCFRDSETLKCFINMMAMAYEEDSEYMGDRIPRGSFPTTLNGLAKELKVTFQKVRTMLNNIKTTNEITFKSTNKYTIVTICNYDSYAVDKNDVQQTNNKRNNKQTTNEVISREIKSTTQENYNHLIESSNNNILVNQEKNNSKENLQKKSSDKKDIVEEFLSGLPYQEMAKPLREWFEYKRQRKQTYQPIGMKKCYNTLVQLSLGDGRKAQEIVDFSIANNYQGLFAPREQTATATKQSKTTMVSETKEQLDKPWDKFKAPKK